MVEISSLQISLLLHDRRILQTNRTKQNKSYRCRDSRSFKMTFPLLEYTQTLSYIQKAYSMHFHAPSIHCRVASCFEHPKKFKNYSTQYSHVVTHQSTNWAITSLTSEIERDPVCSGMYGRSWKFRGALVQIPGIPNITMKMMTHMWTNVDG